ncbi:MAG: hypothetical protein MJZ98_07250 [Paludibacteraceae bacterium]|nr:hypothetical protein [Paludibacteraceae bacterium]
MIQRDYLLAIIEDFFQALAQILYKKKLGKEETRHDIDGLYTRFLENNRAFFLTNNLKTSLQAFSDPTKVSMQKEMLAELLYQELTTFDYQIDKRQIAETLLALYDDIERTEQTFSFQREARRKEALLWLENN